MAKRCDHCGVWITFRTIDGKLLPFEGSNQHFCLKRPRRKSKGGESFAKIAAVCALGLLLLIVFRFVR